MNKNKNIAKSSVSEVEDVSFHNPSLSAKHLKTLYLQGFFYKTEKKRKILPTFKKPSLCTKNPNDWYILYSILDPETLVYKPYKVRLGINRIKDKKERKYEAGLIMEGIHTLLKEGGTPNTGTINILTPKQKKTIIENLDFIMDSKKLALPSKTISIYSTAIDRFKEYLKLNNLDKYRGDEITKPIILGFIDWMRSTLKASNRLYANHLNIVKNFFNELEEREIIQVNHSRKVRAIKYEEGNKNTPPTIEQFDKIRAHLAKVSPGLHNHAKNIYYCALRPKEIRLLQVMDLHFDTGCFDVRSEVSKNKKKQPIRIPDIYLKELEYIKGLPLDWYIFGKNLTPGPEKLSMSFAAKQWKKIIKDGLKIEVDEYALKHRRAIDMYIDGADMREIQYYLRHASVQETEGYMRTLTSFTRKETLDKTREF